MSEQRLDFDDWTAQVTNKINLLGNFIIQFEKRIEELEKQIKELKDREPT